MKAWDTNLVVRHLTEDDAKQLRVVRKELEKESARGQTIWIADVTLVETAWVLQHGYGLNANAMHVVLLQFTEDARFIFQSGSDVRLALERAQNKGDLPEHLIALAAKRAGAEKTQTFDRTVKGFPEFEVW